MRAFYIILANLAIPFVLFYLRNFIYKLFFHYYLKNDDKQIPHLNLKLSLQLLVSGIILLSIFLFFNRLQVTPQQRLHTNQVKQQNLR